MSRFTSEIKIRLTPEQRAALDALAEERSSNASTVAREFIQEHLLKKDPDYRKQVGGPPVKKTERAALIAEGAARYGKKSAP